MYLLALNIITVDYFGNSHFFLVEAFNSTSRYQDDLLNSYIPYFAQMVSQIYPADTSVEKGESLSKKGDNDQDDALIS